MKFELQPILENELLRLTPLKEDDFEGLYSVASDPLIWEQHPNKLRYKRDVFETFFKGAIESQGALLIQDKVTDEIMGTSRFYNLDEVNRSVYIGYTFLARKYWGKKFNSSVKNLMLYYALQFADTVVFQIGANNIRSQKAIERLGAVKVGEENIAYVGETNNLNFVYHMQKKRWLDLQTRIPNV